MLLNAFCYRLVAFGNDLRFLRLWEFKILKNSKPASNASRSDPSAKKSQKMGLEF